MHVYRVKTEFSCINVSTGPMERSKPEILNSPWDLWNVTALKKSCVDGPLTVRLFTLPTVGCSNWAEADGTLTIVAIEIQWTLHKKLIYVNK